MRKMFILALLMAFLAVFGAEFRVSSELNEEELTYIENNYRDANGEFCALITIKTDVADLEFDSDRKPVRIERDHGNFKIYLSPGEKSLVIRKKGFIDLDYRFPLTIKANTAYTMTIVKDGYTSADEGLVKVIFELSESGVYISRNGNPPVLSRQKSAQYKLIPGTYSFTFVKDGFREKVIELDVSEDVFRKVELESGESRAVMKLPGIVMIDSYPQGAEVYINDQFLGNTPWNNDLAAGEYRIIIKKKMYYDLEQKFTVAEGETIELPVFKLKPQYGVLKIQVPEEDPETIIKIDDKEIDHSAAKEIILESGRHKLDITKELHHPYSEEFVLEDGEEKIITPDLKPAYGILQIDSTPVDSVLIFINDEYVGLTPYRNEKLASGKYDLRIEKELYHSVEESILIKDEELTDKVVMLVQNYGTIDVKAEGTSIFINDKYYAKDHYKGRFLPGRYELESRDEKYYTKTWDILLNAGDIKVKDLSPEPRMGAVSVISEPVETKGAEIWIDEKKREERTPAVLPLIIGDHQISLKHTDFLEKTEKFSISEGEQQKLVIQMQTYEGSILAKRDIWQKHFLYGSGCTILTLGLGVMFHSFGTNFEDDYKNATTTQDAVSAWDDMDSSYEKRDFFYTISIVPIVYTIFSKIKTDRYNRELKRAGDYGKE